jgi:Holliday junction resolvase RusA-like endonuclease
VTDDEKVSLAYVGTPLPWKRSKQRGGRHFIDPAEVKYREALLWCWRGAGAVNLGGGPLSWFSRFVLPRPKSHYRADGTLRPDAPRWPDVRPDGDNYDKVVRDALNGHAYRDDGQIVRWEGEKVYALSGQSPCAVIEIRRQA